ncbi:hypothetical protein [Shewanella sp. SE1]|uniref:hypothetical protein n=1 Tax=Shewanella sp. SE1 TaxID=2705014 RepID=UPI00138F2C07|nr:hypothetical protein [Shewanella sp. SE1]NDO76584.1 hypothetical protein [Shewanella sp. SE1]
MKVNMKGVVYVLLMVVLPINAVAMGSFEPGDSSYPQLEVKDYGYNFLEKIM